MYALEINHVNKYYDTFKALHDIDFTIGQGEFVGLLGVNGAGKTSLISSIAGINRFNGSIKVMGYDVIANLVKAKSLLGVVPQELAFDPFLTVHQTLKFQSGLYGVRDNKDWIDEIIERLHLKDKINANVRALSGGMKRRLMVAQALVHKPPLIILDEPTTGVDVEIRQSLWGFIGELHQKGHTILLTTHYLEEVERLCNKIIMMDKGHIIAKDTKSVFMNKCSNLSSSLDVLIQEDKCPDELLSLIIAKKDTTYTFKLNDSSDIANILTVLNKSNIKFDNINIKKPSLEDAFISLLNRG